MPNRSPIARQLLLLVLAFTAFTGMVSYVYHKALGGLAESSSRLVGRSIERLGFCLELLDAVAMAQNSLQGLLRETDVDTVEKLVEQRQQREERLRADIASYGDAHRSVLECFDAWVASSQGVIDTFLRGNTARAHYEFVTVATARYERLVAEVRQLAGQIQKWVQAQASQHENTARAMRTRVLSGSLVASAVLLCMGLLYRRRIVELAARRAQLEETNKIVEAEVARQTAELSRVHKQLVATARRAGMAEVATGVLHNVGNVLNSVNVSASLVAEKVRHSRVSHLVQAAQLIAEHSQDLPEFLANNERGRQLPGFLSRLAEHLNGEMEGLSGELQLLCKHIEHIKEIVSTQQAYACAAGVIDQVQVTDLIEDALRINMAGLTRHDVQVMREFRSTPVIAADKHKLLLILVNLISNAKYAMEGARTKKLTLRVEDMGQERVRISVMDTGVGIVPENLTRVFSHGFSTRKGGHGFGLHSSALAARDMRGTITAHSDGLGKGATFAVEIPRRAEQPAAKERSP